MEIGYNFVAELELPDYDGCNDYDCKNRTREKARLSIHAFFVDFSPAVYRKNPYEYYEKRRGFKYYFMVI